MGNFWKHELTECTYSQLAHTWPEICYKKHVLDAFACTCALNMLELMLEEYGGDQINTIASEDLARSKNEEQSNCI